MFFINEFFEYLRKELNYKASTVRNYNFFLGQFIRYCNEKGISTVIPITGRLVLEFLETINKNSRSEQVQYCRFCKLKIYFDFLQKQGKIFISPIENCPYPKRHETHHPILTQEEIEYILDSIREYDDKCIQGKVMLELLYSSALRPREIVNLKVQDIDFKKQELFILKSKGNKDRVVPVGRRALNLITRYINTTRKKHLVSDSPDNLFFDFKTGKPHNGVQIQTVINYALRFNGFPEIRTYSLRGTAATVLYLNGMGIGHIRKLLGHSKLSSTTIYLRIHDNALKKELSVKHLRLKIKEEKNEN